MEMPSHPSATCLGCTTSNDRPDHTCILLAWQLLITIQWKSPEYPPFRRQDGDPVASPLRHSSHGRRTSAARVPPGEAVGSGKLTHGFRSRRQAPPATFRTPMSYSVCVHVRTYQGPPGPAVCTEIHMPYLGIVGGPAEGRWCERTPLLLLPASRTFLSRGGNMCMPLSVRLDGPCARPPGPSAVAVYCANMDPSNGVPKNHKNVVIVGT